MSDRAEGAQRIGRHLTECRFKAERPGEASWNADRAAPVRTDVQTAHAECRSHGCSPTRAARGHLRIPGIACNTGERGITDTLPTELRRCGFAYDHRAGFAQSCSRRRVLVPSLCAIDGARAAQGWPILGEDQILDRRRHTVDVA